MSGGDVLELARESIWVLIQVAGPTMMAGLVVGIMVSLVQALTQIQEMTLAFVPKILAIFLSFVLFLPFMSAAMGGLMERIAARIVTLE